MRRAAFTALIVGSILAGISHGPAVFAGQLTGERMCQILLTFLVPYSVSTVSSVATRLEINSRPAPASQPPSVVYSAPDAV
jgi:hypothetical protein